MKEALLVDIDGIIEHRPNYTPKPTNFDWNDWLHAKAVPIEEGIALVKQLTVCAGLHPVFLTARPEQFRAQTEEMLASYGLYGDLFITPKRMKDFQVCEDFRMIQAEMKRRILNDLVLEYNFAYGIDDQQENCDMFREFGIPTLRGMFV